jgi:hypothetical protein
MMLAEVMAAEVVELCGEKYHPSEDTACHRAGNTSGYVLWEGNREDVKRAMARKSSAATKRTSSSPTRPSATGSMRALAGVL